jgi:hypothetical protein
MAKKVSQEAQKARKFSELICSSCASWWVTTLVQRLLEFERFTVIA